MFREMRRKNQALSEKESLAILRRGSSGVLAVLGEGGYPYAVPLSYVYDDSKIYFHCASSGHKLDAIAQNDRVSFCVIDQDEVVPQEFTTFYRSVIVFGRARVLHEEGVKRAALELLAAKYSPGEVDGRAQEIEKSFRQVCMVEITIEHISGKEAIELTRRREE